jgi:hypothetical protein
MNSAFPSPLDALWSAPREWDDDLVVALSFVGWLVTLLVAIALVVGLVLFFATSGFWSGGGDPPSYALTSVTVTGLMRPVCRAAVDLTRTARPSMSYELVALLFQDPRHGAGKPSSSASWWAR